MSTLQRLVIDMSITVVALSVVDTDCEGPRELYRQTLDGVVVSTQRFLERQFAVSYTNECRQVTLVNTQALPKIYER